MGKQVERHNSAESMLTGTWHLAQKLMPQVLCEQDAIFSPACVFQGLRAMQLGAAGKTARELDELLGAPAGPSDADSSPAVNSLHDGSSHDDVTMLASGIWLDDKARPQAGIVEQCETCGIPVRQTDLSSPETGTEISRWINQKTNGMLSLQIEPDAEALVCLISALYFKDTWCSTFDERATKRKPFHTPCGDVRAAFMREIGYFRVLDLDVATILALPFLSGAELRLALPRDSKTPNDLRENTELLNAIAHFNAPEVYADVSIPKFSCGTTLRGLESQLARAGFASAATPDLSPLTGHVNAPASYVHATRLTVNEEGAEGSSYFFSAVAAGIPPKMPIPRVIVFDRPILFALVSPTGQPLFLGRVDRPQAEERS